MPSLRLYPLLVAGAACLTLAACGGDDPPPQANAPAQTEAAPAQTAPAPDATTTAPDATTATDGAPAGGDGSADETNDSGAASADATSTTPQSPDGTSDSAKSTPSKPAADSSTSPSKKDKSPSSGTSGGPNSSEAAKVRDTLIDLQEAFAAKDGKKACSLMIGVPEKTDPKNPGLSCESLSQGPKADLPEETRKFAANAKVTVNADEATAELAPGVPFTLRKIDGRWRVDYSQMARPGGGSR